MGMLTEKLRAKNIEKDGRNRHRVSFLAHKADIVEAIREGWAITQIWQQLREDGQIAMCYSSFCTLVRREIPKETETADVKGQPATPPADAGTAPEMPAPRAKPDAEKSLLNNAAEKSTPPERALTREEILEQMKQEAFAAVRAPKPHGSLLVKPLSREEERRKLFGDNV